MKMMESKNRFASILLLCSLAVAGLSFSRLRAQENAQFSQFFNNRTFYNPAAMSSDGLLHVALTDREQYLGNYRHPSFRQLAGSYYFTERNMAIGWNLYQWNANIENNILFKINYMYCLRVGYDAYINFGINVGVKQRFLSAGTLPSGEPFVPTSEDRYNPNLDLGVGLEFHTSNIVAGVSVQNFPIKLGPNPYVEGLHSYYYFGYNFYLNDDWALMPLVAVRVAEKSANLDIQLRATYRDVVYFGATYRLDAVVVQAGVTLGKNFALGYAFDLNIGSTSKRFKPSHEIVLSYRGLFRSPDRPMILSY